MAYKDVKTGQHLIIERVVVVIGLLFLLCFKLFSISRSQSVTPPFPRSQWELTGRHTKHNTQRMLNAGHLQHPLTLYYGKKNGKSFAVEQFIPFNRKLDLNRASVEELSLIEGIGEKTAEQIVHFRQTVRPFRSVADLLDVPGLGKVTYLKLMRADVLCVRGAQ